MKKEITNEQVQKHGGMVVSIANKIYSIPVIRDKYQFEDLISMGNVGLVKGLANLNTVRESESTYLYTCIKGQILQYIRDDRFFVSHRDERFGTAFNSLNVKTDSENGTCELMDIITDESDDIESLVEKEYIVTLLEVLTKAEKEVVKLKYFDDMSQRQIANLLGVSQATVSRLEIKAMKKLREKASEMQC